MLRRQKKRRMFGEPRKSEMNEQSGTRFYGARKGKVIKRNLKSSLAEKEKIKTLFFLSAEKRKNWIIIEMETRGNIHLNKKFIKNIYLYGAIKDEIEIFAQ